jgi:transposase
VRDRSHQAGGPVVGGGLGFSQRPVQAAPESQAAPAQVGAGALHRRGRVFHPQAPSLHDRGLGPGDRPDTSCLRGQGRQGPHPLFGKTQKAWGQAPGRGHGHVPRLPAAVRKVFPDLDIVHDPYHVVALANRAIDETRRDMYRNLKGQEQKIIKGSRFLLLSALDKLSPASLSRLTDLMEMNLPLYQAYLLKEDLRMFFNCPNLDPAQSFLDSWLQQARALGNKHFAKLADTLDSHRPGLLAYFRHRITTGPLEGLNNKIKVLKRQAYGFRDNEYFKLRLYFLHDSMPAFAR